MSEDISDLPENLTIYSSQVGIDNMTLYFGNKKEVLSKFWNLYVEEVKYNITEPSCYGITHLENWHYMVYDSGKCYLARIGNNQNETIVDLPNEPKTIHINSQELALGTFVDDNFRAIHSNRGYHYIFVMYEGTQNIAECGVHCIFDSEDKCDFYYFHDSVCYLGNFNILSPIENVYTGEVTNYINNKNLNDMRDTLYEFHINVTESNWRKHIVETMTNISTEIECGAIAALYFPHEIDFYRYESHECFLGDMTQTKEEDTGLTNNSLIKIHKCEYIPVCILIRLSLQLYIGSQLQYMLKTIMTKLL